MKGKLTVFTMKDHNWEYRCTSCGQLRFYPSEEKPTTCGNCGSNSITVGRPGELPPELDLYSVDPVKGKAPTGR